MRFFRVTEEPTAEQLARISGTMIEGRLAEAAGYFVSTEADMAELPEWLEATDEISVPGEPARCANCGELI
jgi:hypothetical protein